MTHSPRAVTALEPLRDPRDPLSFAWVSVLRLGLALVAAEVSYRLIDAPFLRLKDHFEPGQERETRARGTGGEVLEPAA